MRCPNCNSPVEKGDTFCDACGIRLAGKQKSGVLVTAVCLVLTLAAAGGIGAWVLSGEHHTKDDVISALEKEAEKNGDEAEEGGAGQEAGNEQKAGEEPEDEQGQSDVKKEDAQKTAGETEEEDAPVYDSREGGIHRYEYVVSDCTWTEAYQECIAKGGYLARINSREEFEYIIDEIGRMEMQSVQFRIGGRRELNSQEYYWVDGKNQLYGEKINSDSYWCSPFWMSGEPSFRDKDIEENCLDIFYYKKAQSWVFNDVPDDMLASEPKFSGKIGYICEYEN